MPRKKSLAKKYDELPKEVKVLPYLFISAGFTAVADYLRVIEIDNPLVAVLVMGITNLIVVFLTQIKPRVIEFRKH